MTMRDLGETGIKLIGVYLAAAGVIGVFDVIQSLASPPIEGFPSTATIALLNLLHVIGVIGTAVVCLLWGRQLAERLFVDRDQRLSGLSRRDLLSAGLGFLGVGLAATALPEVIQFFGRALWLAEGTRQELLPTLMKESWQSLSNNLIKLALGIALAIKAVVLATMLDRKPVRVGHLDQD